MKKIIAFVCLVLTTIAVSARKDIWVIDPGHGGRDTGCEGAISREKDITLAIAKEVGRLVDKNIKGVRVVYTRERDKYPTLPERCELANSKGAKLFISIHVNDAANRFASGTESYFATNVPQSGANVGKSELLALLLQRQYLANGRGVSRGVKQEAWYVCEHTNMPSVLTEVGFISNLEEEAFMNSKEGQAVLARSIYEALAEWQRLTEKGLDKRTLRNLRYAYFDPRTERKATPTVTVIKQQNATGQLAQNQPATPPVVAQVPVSTPAQQAAQTQPEPTPEPKVEPTPEPKAEPKPEAKPTTKPEAKAEAKAESKQDAKPEPKSDVKPEAKPEPKADAKPVYSIQIMTLSAMIKPDDYRLKGETNIRFVQVADRYKLLIGAVGTYQEAKNLQAQVREKFPDAFIVAYVADRQVTTAEAMKLE